MKLVAFDAYLKLIQFERYLAKGDFPALYRKVGRYPTARMPATPGTADRICMAVELACIWYWKEVLCLQRAAVTCCLLKQYGVAAEMVIGARQMPFKAHAWVEVEGRVVNDKPYIPEIYMVLDRC
jgi:hypothetical protein